MKKNNMKKGITLIEIILAIVLIAIILGITIPKLMSNSERAELKSVITSDVKSIVESAMLWKKASASAQNNFMSIDANDLNSRLPSNMVVDGTQGIIFSSGLNSGNQDANGFNQTGVQYHITWTISNDANHQDTANFSIAMDITNGATDLTWDAKTQQYAQDVFNDTIAELTNGTATVSTSGTFNGGVNNSTGGTYTAPTGGATVTCGGNVVCYDNVRFQ